MHRTILLRTLFVLALCLTATSFAKSTAHAGEEATTYLAKLEVGRSELQCDGDSTSLLFEIRKVADDTPAAGVEVSLAGGGTFTSANGTTSETRFIGTTNSRGIVRVRYAPRGFNSWALIHGFGEHNHIGQIRYAVMGACAFRQDTAYVLRGEIFLDANSDGIRNRGERLFKEEWLGLQRGGYSYFDYIPYHHSRTDGNGQFAYTGLWWDESRPWLTWNLCLGVQAPFKENETQPYPRRTNRADDDYAIVSVNGAVDPTKPDCRGFALVPGENNVSIGVQRVR